MGDDLNIDIPEDALPDPRSKDVEFHEIGMIDVNLIDPNPWNPNEQDEKTFNRLVQEIRDVGFLEPIHVVPYQTDDGEARYLILGGEHRWRAAGVVGMKKVPAMLLKHKRFDAVDFQKIMTVRLNALKGRLNKEKMVKLFHDFADKYSSEEVRDMFAFTSKDAWEKLVGDMRKGLKKSGLPDELMSEFDKSAKTARTVEDLSKIVQHLYDMYSDTVPFGFMVFTYGKKEHVYVSMTKQTKASLDRVLSYAKATRTELNELLAPAFKELADRLAVE